MFTVDKLLEIVRKYIYNNYNEMDSVIDFDRYSNVKTSGTWSASSTQIKMKNGFQPNKRRTENDSAISHCPTFYLNVI